MKRIALFILSASLFVACENDTNLINSNQVEKYLTASIGGELTLSDSIKLTIPAGSLPTDGKVFLGLTGSEASTMPNLSMEIIGSPITIRLPTDSLLNSIFLEFSKPANLDTIRTCIWGFNGSTYFPFPYSIVDGKFIVTLDIIDWAPTTLKSTGVSIVGEFIIYMTYSKQYPSLEQLGLKRVIINNNGQLSFQTPSIKPASKVLLLVHGWTGDANTWDVFLSRIQANASLDYSEIWTFVYISAFSIRKNASILKESLTEYANEKQVDIVAHSMGGLVARSMIEQYDGLSYINKIITLGTPHEGSPLAVFRYLLAALVDKEDLIQYNLNTQGFRDLNVGSKFIESLNQPKTQEMQYFTIASVNDPEDPSNSTINKFFSQQSSKLLTGDDDGIVQVSSALAIQEATSPEAPIKINTAWAHIAMPDNDIVYQQVLEYLQEKLQDPENDIIFNPDLTYGSITDLDGNIYRTIEIGNQTWMAENLKVTKYNDGSAIPIVTNTTQWKSLTSGAYCWYQNNETSNKEPYGALYNWYAVNTGKLCPNGWHNSSDAEWKQLEMQLGMSQATADIFGWRGAPAGGKLKESGLSHWQSPNTDATNETGFTSLPSGIRWNIYSDFSGIHAGGNFWTATEYSSTEGWYRGLYWDRSTICREGDPKWYGFSVRCVMD